MELKVVAFLDESHPCLDGEGNEVSFVYPCAGFKEDPGKSEPISTVEIYLAAEKYGGKVLDYKVPASEGLLAAIAEFSNHHDGKKTGLDCYSFETVFVTGKVKTSAYLTLRLVTSSVLATGKDFSVTLPSASKTTYSCLCMVLIATCSLHLL
jgi:hypothetical protein